MVSFLGFLDLEKTIPDANYLPVYPPGILALDGTRVRLIGFMAPFDSLTYMTVFMLFPSPRGLQFLCPSRS